MQKTRKKRMMLSTAGDEWSLAAAALQPFSLISFFREQRRVLVVPSRALLRRRGCCRQFHFHYSDCPSVLQAAAVIVRQLGHEHWPGRRCEAHCSAPQA